MVPLGANYPSFVSHIMRIFHLALFRAAIPCVPWAASSRRMLHWCSTNSMWSPTQSLQDSNWAHWHWQIPVLPGQLTGATDRHRLQLELLWCLEAQSERTQMENAKDLLVDMGPRKTSNKMCFYHEWSRHAIFCFLRRVFDVKSRVLAI